MFLIVSYLASYNADTKTNIFCLPQNTQKISFLRGPNRSKAAQVLIGAQKYKIILNIGPQRSVGVTSQDVFKRELRLLVGVLNGV